MDKRTLQDLSKEEIGQLFPIEISVYKDHWPKLYEEEKEQIIKAVDPNLFYRIEHFGSHRYPAFMLKTR